MLTEFGNIGVVIAADINEAALEEVSQKENVVGMKLNVASDEEWQALAKEVNERYGRIDILVNNAGISSEKPFQEIDLNDWQKMLAINGFGPFAGIKHVAPYMAAQGKGSIINISSYTAQIGQGFNHYSASKGAVRALSKAAATTFGRQGVHRFLLCESIILQTQLELKSIEAMKRLMDTVMPLMNQTRQWELKGYTPDELFEWDRKDRKSMSPLPKKKGEVVHFQTKQKVGRNDPCPCGSGEKYKKCCGKI